ncbi:hypothetical protein QYE76_060936 [Lolium multiflorum]|uniref:Zinc knuckle CX2CX4HX4C domain-containing protein n=1 Tax=Lolium multiflorum TaxID=4521 RepID=A0AAD8RZT2_LOLMU|nr:hypothetical protein QYE76_060936 [Lolium multiflorum]
MAGQVGSDMPLEDLLRSLNLKGEDIAGITVAKAEVESLRADTKWMAVMRLLSPKPFSVTSLKKTMKFAWAPAQEIHDVPELYRKKSIITNLAESVGTVITVDMNSSRVDGGDFVRVRVWLDVRKELTRFVTIKPEGEPAVIMRVKYEKVPRYCAVCGLLGHVQEECGTGVHAPGAVGFGKWMLADTAWNRTQIHGEEGMRGQSRGMNQDAASKGRGAGRSGRGFASRGGGRTRGQDRGAAPVIHENRKRNSTDARLEASPVKDGQNVTAPPLMLTWKEPGVIGMEDSTKVQRHLIMEKEDGGQRYEPRSGTPPPPPSAREQKRSKKHSTPKKDKNELGSAGSVEEHCRDQ